MPRIPRLSLAFVALALTGCPEPDSVPIGGECKAQIECKDPADTCVTLGGKTICSVPCSATKHCPEGYACARTGTVTVEGNDGGDKASAEGYCMAKATLGKHIVTIKPESERKQKRKAKRAKRKQKRKDKAAEAE